MPFTDLGDWVDPQNFCEQCDELKWECICPATGIDPDETGAGGDNETDDE